MKSTSAKRGTHPLARLLARVRAAAGLSLRQLGELSGTSHATLSAYENGRKEPSLAVASRIAAACGYDIEVMPVRRIRYRNGVTRGDELEAVLALAEQFPARHRSTLDFPRLMADE